MNNSVEHSDEITLFADGIENLSSKFNITTAEFIYTLECLKVKHIPKMREV